MNRFDVWPIVLLSLVIASCSKAPENPTTYRVTGQILWEGKPASGAVVILHHADGSVNPNRPRAITDAKGEFTLTTFTSGDGAPAGEYTVTVEWKKAEDGPEQGVDRIPQAYGDPKLSKLKTKIVAGSNEPLVLKLQQKP